MPSPEKKNRIPSHEWIFYCIEAPAASIRDGFPPHSALTKAFWHFIWKKENRERNTSYRRTLLAVTFMFFKDVVNNPLRIFIKNVFHLILRQHVVSCSFFHTNFQCSIIKWDTLTRVWYKASKSVNAVNNKTKRKRNNLYSSFYYAVV